MDEDLPNTQSSQLADLSFQKIYYYQSVKRIPMVKARMQAISMESAYYILRNHRKKAFDYVESGKTVTWKINAYFIIVQLIEKPVQV